MSVDSAAVLFGAAIHDLGKALGVSKPSVGELSGAGTEHEAAGAASELEELLVTLADKVWKGRRETGLEKEVAKRIAAVEREPLGTT